MRLFVLTMVGIGLMSGAALGEGDAAKGEKNFKKCMACHTIADKTNKVGPHLVGLLALQLPFLQVSESMGNHDSEIVDARGVD